MKSYRIILSIFSLIGATLICRAQENVPSRHERPDLWTRVQDSVWVPLVVHGDTAEANQISGSYRFVTTYDTLCTISYTFTEPHHEGRRLKLLNWQQGGPIDGHQEELSAASRTEDFTVAAGDTIGFLRELTWYPWSGQQTPENYFNRDTLLYIVDLLRSSDSARLLSLDTVGALPRLWPGPPHILDGRPLMDAIRYVVPFSFNDMRVFMQLRLRGPENPGFTRFDGITGKRSAFLRDRDVMQAHEKWVRLGRSKEAYDIDELVGMEVMTVEQRESTVIVTPVSMEAGPVTIDVRGPRKERMYILYNGMLDEAPVLTHWFPSGGTYYITAMRGKVVIQSEKIVVGE